jgi:thymidine kinase
MADNIQLIVGPMFAGKSTELLRRIKRHRLAGKKCMLVSHATDTRTKKGVSTHDDKEEEALRVTCAKDALSRIPADVQVVGVDEGQFFEDLRAFVALARRATVIIAGLNGTFDAKPFPSITDIIPFSTSITLLTAICVSCGEDAIFSKRKGASKDVVLVGSSDAYQPACFKCFNA